MCGLGPELKAEVASLVQAALSKIHPEYDSSAVKLSSSGIDISLLSAQEFAETERKSYKDIVASLEAQLAASNKQLQDAYSEVHDLKGQVETQKSKTIQLEQRILQLTKAEGNLKGTYNHLCVERESASAREREAVIARDQLRAQNAQLSSQLTDVQNECELKVAQYNDAMYKNKQLEARISELTKENAYWQQHSCFQAAAPSSAPAQSPTAPRNGPTVYFSAPSVRRHTIPNAYAPSAPTTSLPQETSRPPKRTRTDSDASGTSGSAHSGVSSSSVTFPLRPVKLEPIDTNLSSSGAPISSPSNTTRYPPSLSPQVYVPSSNAATHAQPRYTAYAQPIYAQQPPLNAPIPYNGQAPLRPVPSHAPMPASGPVNAPVPMFAQQAPPGSAPRPAPQVRTEAPFPAHLKQFLDRVFTCLPNGHLECNFCKARPSSRNSPTASPNNWDLLGHVQKYHAQAMSAVNAQAMSPVNAPQPTRP